MGSIPCMQADWVPRVPVCEFRDLSVGVFAVAGFQNLHTSRLGARGTRLPFPPCIEKATSWHAELPRRRRFMAVGKILSTSCFLLRLAVKRSMGCFMLRL